MSFMRKYWLEMNLEESQADIHNPLRYLLDSVKID